jgi:hypothetical protein
MKKAIAFLYMLLLCTCMSGISQTVHSIGDLIANKTNGSWTNPLDWDTWNGTAVVSQSTATPTLSSDVFILSGDTYILPSSGTRQCKILTIDAGGKLYTNVSTNRFLDVYGDIICNGIIGNGTSFDGISFNMEGVSCTISGTGSFDCARIRKNSNTNAVTSLLVDMNANLRFNGTALYNNSSSASLFNITIAAGVTVNCPGDGTANSGGSVAIDGIDGTGTGYMGGTITVNGILNLSGIGTVIPKLYLTTDNTNTAYPVAVTIGSTGAINAPSIICSNSSAAGSTLKIDSGGVLNITDEPSVYTAPGITNNTYLFLPGATIEYSRSGNQTIYSFGSIHYPALICSGGTKSIATSMTIDSTLTLDASSILSIGNDTLTLTGNITGAGTLNGSSNAGLVIANNGAIDPVLSFTNAAVLHDLILNANARATLGNMVSIVAGTNAGNVSLATGSILTTNGNLTLRSDANGTARVGISSGTISGNVVVERYIPAHRAWRLLGAPFISNGAPTINEAWQDTVFNADRLSPLDPDPGYGTEITTSTVAQNGYDQGSTNNPSLDYFTGTKWAAVPATNQGAITDYPGYFLFVRGDRSIIVSNAGVTATPTTLHPQGQVLIGSKNISIPAAGLQVIGDPYASAINFNSIYNHNNTSGVIANSYYLWDPELTGNNGVGGFVALTDDGTGTGNYVYNVQPASPIDLHGGIESGAAFFINAIGPGTITINESDKSSGSADVFRPAITSDPLKYIRTSLYSMDADNNAVPVDGALTLFNNNFSDSVIWSEDVMKLINSNENIAINKQDHLISIEKRGFIGEADSVLYELTQLHQQQYILSLSARGLSATGLAASLYDNYTNRFIPVNLDGDTNDSFSVTQDIASSDANRFKLIFGRPAIALPVKFSNIKGYKQNGTALIEWNIANQSGIDYYEIERSSDASFFETIGYVDINDLGSYQYIDKAPLAGKNYYRVKVMNADGTILYSPTIEIDNDTMVCNSFFQNGMLHLHWGNLPEGIYAIALYDNSGRVLFRTGVNVGSKNMDQSLIIDKNMAAGIYELEITAPNDQHITNAVIYR